MRAAILQGERPVSDCAWCVSCVLCPVYGQTRDWFAPTRPENSDQMGGKVTRPQIRSTILKKGSCPQTALSVNVGVGVDTRQSPQGPQPAAALLDDPLLTLAGGPCQSVLVRPTRILALPAGASLPAGTGAAAASLGHVPNGHVTWTGEWPCCWCAGYRHRLLARGRALGCAGEEPGRAQPADRAAGAGRGCRAAARRAGPHRAAGPTLES
jgi:hypothetical protein